MALLESDVSLRLMALEAGEPSKHLPRIAKPEQEGMDYAVSHSIDPVLCSVISWWTIMIFVSVIISSHRLVLSIFVCFPDALCDFAHHCCLLQAATKTQKT